MDANESAYFDLKTVALLRETVEDAWACLRPEQRETISRSLLAERILKAAAQGERDPQRLLDAALERNAGHPSFEQARQESTGQSA
jgi:hypothetical protein